MALFDNSDPEEFLFFVKNFKMMTKASEILAANAKLQYLRMLLHGEVLRRFYNFCAQVGSKNTVYLN